MYKNNLSQSLGIFSEGQTCSEKTSLVSEQVAGAATALRRKAARGASGGGSGWTLRRKSPVGRQRNGCFGQGEAGGVDAQWG